MSDERDTARSSSQPESPAGTTAAPDEKRRRTRRRVMVAAGIAALLILGVLVPGYVATRPSYMQRFANLRPAHDSWSSSVHAQVTCQQCHVSPGVLARTGYGVRMLGEFYLSVFDRTREPDVMDKPTNAACSHCHIDLRTVSPSGDLNIPHRAHVTVLKLECVQCHEFLVHEASPEGRHTPRMVACLTCHDGKQAKNACSTCHTSKAAPASHRADDWLIVHPDRQTTADCRSCHDWTEKWCVECHTKRPKSHTGDWRKLHGDAVAVRRNCEACHEPGFCVRCHGEVPTQNLSTAPKLVQ